MEQKSKTIIDGNSIGFLAQQCGMSLKAGDQETTSVFGTVQIIRDIVTRRRGSGILVLWDGRSWRKDFSDTYKANRETTAKQATMRKTYKSQTPYIRDSLTALGVTQAIASNLEADDLAAMLADRYVKNGEKVYLYTRDRDWLQMVQPGVVWMDHKDHTRISHKKFEEVTGYEDRHHFSQSKALQGDSSDNIKGVGGIGEKKAKTLIDIWDSVENFLSDENPAETWSKTESGKFPKAMADFHADEEKHSRFRDNLRMMDLTQPAKLPEPVDLTVTKGNFNRARWEAICRELAFHSFLKDMDNFIHPFTPLLGD